MGFQKCWQTAPLLPGGSRELSSFKNSRYPPEKLQRDGYRWFQEHPSDLSARGLRHPDPRGTPANTAEEPEPQALSHRALLCLPASPHAPPQQPAGADPIQSTPRCWEGQNHQQVLRGWVRLGFPPPQNQFTLWFDGSERKKAKSRGRTATGRGSSSETQNFCAFLKLQK